MFRKVFALAALVLVLLPALVQSQGTTIACAPVATGQPTCHVTLITPIDPNITQLLLIPDSGGATANITLPVSAPNTVTVDKVANTNTYDIRLPLTIVPIGNTPHTLKAQACQGTTVANAVNCSTASTAAPQVFTSSLGAMISTSLALAP